MDNNQEFFLDVNSNANGIYLSQLQIDLLLIINLSSKEEVKNYVENLCTQFPNKKVGEVIQDFDSLDLESCKRRLFKTYQDNLISYLENSRMSPLEQAAVKLEKMGISQEEQKTLLDFIKNGQVNEAYNHLRKNHGDNFIIKFNRFKKDDFENVKSVDYDYMKMLDERIKSDKKIDTIIIATGKFDNSVFTNGQSNYFDPYLTYQGLEYCKIAGKHMRYHALFDYARITRLLKDGKGIENHDEILNEMRQFISQSFSFINSHNDIMPDGSMRINMVEVFNELVEYNKQQNDRDNYQMAWEKYFGITIDDILSCFDGIDKPKNVEFMYNETMLEESPVRRKKVEEVYSTIMIKRPDLIDKFGNQMHVEHLHGTPRSDNNPRGIEEVSETFDLMKKIQNGYYFTDENQVTHQIQPSHVEITEFDIHIDQSTMINKIMPMLQNGQITTNQITRMKKEWIANISKLAKEKDLNTDRISYWSITDTVDHNLCRANCAIQQENIENGTNIPLIDNVYAGLFGSPNQFPTQATNYFDTRSNSEIQIAEQIRAKNRIIAEQKKAQLQSVNQKKLVKTNQNTTNNFGIVNTAIIIGLIFIAISTLIYLILK